MSLKLTRSESDKGQATILLLRNEDAAEHPELKSLAALISQKLQDRDNGLFCTYVNGHFTCVAFLKDDAGKTSGEIWEEARVKGGHLTKKCNHEKSSSARILRAGSGVSSEELIACAEGMALANYQFNKYKKDRKQNTLQELFIADAEIDQSTLDVLSNTIAANAITRDLGNEPVNALNSVQLSAFVQQLFAQMPVEVQVMDKKAISDMGMGGLLGVNMGSSIPPTFTRMDYKPAGHVNAQPVIFIGKGVTYDTGGYSLKPSNAMSGMKMDMHGAATVIGTMYAVAKNALPVYCIGLVPSTDNRVNSDALVPDDIITMHDGTSVEVLNTDAEGRLILADALSYAQQFNPELVIDLATLTGAAAMITGTLGSALMGTDNTWRQLLIACGNDTYERLWEIPYWKEYADMLKSDIADLKNIGGAIGGSATAGKFLEHFTSYPWLHLDIAGPAILKEEEPYKPKGASGVGVRLLFRFMQKFAERA